MSRIELIPSPFMTAWFEDEELWRMSRSCMFPEASFSAGPAEASACIRLACLRGRLDILDLPCGPGRHALPLARLGHRVVAVDRTQAYLDEIRLEAAVLAKRRGKELELEVHCADMRQFLRPSSFDLALNLFHSFGYFRDPSDDLDVLRNFYGCLRPGGALVLQLQSRETLLPLIQPRQEAEIADGLVLVQERRVENEGGWMWVQWSFFWDDEIRHFDLSHRIYDADSLGQLLEKAGFAVVEFFGNFRGEALSPASTSLIAVARR